MLLPWKLRMSRTVFVSKHRPADWQSAIQKVGNLRYDGAAVVSC